MSTIRTGLLLGGLLTVMGTVPGLSQPAGELTDHGVAVRATTHQVAMAMTGPDGERLLVAALIPFSPRSVYFEYTLSAFSVETGDGVRVEVPGRPLGFCGGPFMHLRSTRNRMYTVLRGHFYEFDPSTLRFSHLEQIHETRSCSMAMLEDRAGTIWTALYPSAELLSFDPETRELVNHGQLNEETWPQYPRCIAADAAGWIYVGIGDTRNQVAGYNPETGETRTYVPEATRRNTQPHVFTGSDGRVYATAERSRSSPPWGWHVLLAGEAAPIQRPPVGAALHFGGVYGSSSDGRPVLEYPDGSRISDVDFAKRRMVVEEPDGTARELILDYELTGGARIVSLTLAPDGQIYGSTARPLHIFRFDPRAGVFVEDHHLSRADHCNTMKTRGNLIYMGRYSDGALLRYEFSRPWAPEDDTHPNPAVLGKAPHHVMRPHTLVLHPDGRHLMMGGGPSYGRTGGGLYMYDTETGDETLLSDGEMVENQSTYTLAVLPDDNLVGGTTVAPGTGGQRLANEAELYIFEWQKRQVAWREVIVPGCTRIDDLLVAADGLVYGLATGAGGKVTLFVFDAQTRQVVHQESLEQYGPSTGLGQSNLMLQGADGVIFILFRYTIVALKPGSFEHSKLADIPLPVGAEEGLVLHEGRLYFSSSSHLWSYRLPHQHQ